MKKLITIYLLLTTCFYVKAQYYGNPYITPQSMQFGYEWGRQLAQQQQAEQEERDKSSFGGCYSRYANAMANQNFDEAEEWAENLKEHNEKLGYYYLGVCYEVEGYSKLAKQCYQQGVAYGDKNCKSNLNRLNSEGELTAQQKRNVVAYFVSQVATVSSLSFQATEDMFGGNTNTNRSRSAQNANCTKCYGTGYDPTPYTYSASASSYLNSAGHKCSYCGRTTKHYHYKCPH